jgi:heptaprenyl diphosphate synthase
MQNSTNVKKVTAAALLAALALIFSYIEVLIPFNFGIPGIKLGIANLVVIIALYYLGIRYALLINLLRVFISGLLFSGLFGMLYSLAGALLSMAVMILLKRTNVFSITGVSMAGGVAHNLGQILTAAFVISNLKVFIYFPVLIISGVVSGAVIGILAYLILKKLPGAAPDSPREL